MQKPRPLPLFEHAGPRASCVLGAFALFAGALALLGWFANIPRLTHWDGSGISMQPNTALCAILAGGAVVLAVSRRGLLAALLGAMVFAIAGATLIQHIASVDFGIDRLLVWREWGQRGTVAPGRMGPLGATCWSLVGASLVMGNLARRFRPLMAAGGFVVCAISMLSLVGYLYGVEPLYTIPRVTAIAFQTATILFAIGAALAALVPDRGFMSVLTRDDAGGDMLRRLLVPLVVMSVVTGWVRIGATEAEWLDLRFGVALRTLTEILITVALVTWAARALSRTDRAREDAEGRLRDQAMLLQIGRERLEMALSSARMVAWERDLASGRVDTTDSIASFHGLAPESFGDSGEHGLQFIHPDDVERHRATVTAALEDRGSYVSEFRIVRPTDRSIMWIEERGRAACDDAGRLTRIHGISMDITDRKHVQESLVRSEQKFRMLGDAAPMLISLADPDGRITYVNQHWSEFSGSPSQEFFGQWRDVIHPDDQQRIVDSWQRAVAQGEPYEYEFRARHVSGDFRWLFARGRPIRNETGEVVSWINCAVDIHARKLAEEALKQSDREKDRFLAILAHELRNPLAPIRNAAEILSLKEFSALEVRRPILMIERQVAHMTRLIDDLLEISRISRGALALRLDRVLFQEVAHAAVDACQSENDSRGHTLRIELPVEPTFLNADFDRLVQVFHNLLSNAAKYTANGGHIELRGQVAGDVLEIRVTDDGIGIPKDKLTTIFELFSQIDRSLERQGGLGIGLTLARQLVELHHGTIEARSAGIGHGSTFVTRLPITIPPPDPGAVASRGALRPVERRRILVADDNRDAAESFAMLLSLRGNIVKVAFDGAAALELAGEFRPEIAFLDIGMPRMNGYEVARSIRELPHGGTICLVALTGWGQESDRERAERAGFDAHVVKPAEPAALERILGSLCRRRTETAPR